jgi:hypothetical protein
MALGRTPAMDSGMDGGWRCTELVVMRTRRHPLLRLALDAASPLWPRWRAVVGTNGDGNSSDGESGAMGRRAPWGRLAAVLGLVTSLGVPAAALRDPPVGPQALSGGRRRSAALGDPVARRVAAQWRCHHLRQSRRLAGGVDRGPGAGGGLQSPAAARPDGVGDDSRAGATASSGFLVATLVATTRMACPPDQPKRRVFLPLAGQPTVVPLQREPADRGLCPQGPPGALALVESREPPAGGPAALISAAPAACGSAS